MKPCLHQATLPETAVPLYEFIYVLNFGERMYDGIRKYLYVIGTVIGQHRNIVKHISSIMQPDTFQIMAWRRAVGTTTDPFDKIKKLKAKFGITSHDRDPDIVDGYCIESPIGEIQFRQAMKGYRYLF